MQADFGPAARVLHSGHRAVPFAIHTDTFPAALNDEGVTLILPKGAQIYAQGEPAQYTYLVIAGCARVVKLLMDGRRQVTEFVMRGDVFGLGMEAELDAGAEAVTEITLRRFRRGTLDVLAGCNRDIAAWRHKLLSAKLFRAHEFMLTLGRRTAAERLAGFLLDMEDRMPAGNGSVVALPMNRADIGDHLGLTVETVSRNFTSFERAGAIARTDTGFRIRNRAALEDFANATVN